MTTLLAGWGLLFLVAGLLLVFPPGGGLLPRWRRRRRLSGRVLVEDALKHVQEAEYRGGKATLQSLAGALSVPMNEAAQLAGRMEAHGLLQTAGEGLATTAEGRDYALQVIRAHRLWERYLADETGVAEWKWHAKAERREHALTPAETDALAARLGHPRFDPHGDPIPTSHGELPPEVGGAPLSDLPAGRPARVVHIEDEPSETYVHLVQAGLHVGTRIRILDVGPESLRLRADGEEMTLSRLRAASVSVVETGEEDDRADRPTGRLSDLALGEYAEIVTISRACRGLERRRLMDLGIVPGTRIEAIMRSPSGDPTAYLIRGTTIAIRRSQAERIRVRREADSREKAS